MKFLKRFWLILGAVLVVATAIVLLYEFRLSTNSLNAIISAAVTNKSSQDNHAYDPTLWGIWAGIGGALVGGLVLGLGIAWPSRTFKAKLEAKQAEDAAKAQAEAAKAAEKAQAEAAKAAEKAARRHGGEAPVGPTEPSPLPDPLSDPLVPPTA